MLESYNPEGWFGVITQVINGGVQSFLERRPVGHRPPTWGWLALLMQGFSQGCPTRGYQPMVCMLLACCGQQCMPFWVIVGVAWQHGEA